jgi:hypothetical protein
MHTMTNTDRTPDDIFAECTGTRLGQLLTEKIALHFFTGGTLETHREISELIHGELMKLSQEVREGDWIELPDGTAFHLNSKGCTP